MMGPGRPEKILAGNLGLLFRGHIAVPINIIVAGSVAYLLRNSFPAWFLITWFTATVLVGIGRLLLHRAFMKTKQQGTASWAIRFTIGTFASGAVWGTLCGTLAIWGTTDGYVLMTFVSAGMTAGSMATFSSYMPAYLAYATPFTLPLAVASLLSKNEVIVGNGVLIMLYFTVITLTCYYFNRFVNHTLELQVHNEILRENLHKTQRERDHARTEQWSALAQLSHELRTPLNAILGFSEAMRDGVLGELGNRRYKDYANHIHTSGHQLLTLASELLLLTEGESGTLTLNEEPIAIADIIRGLIAHKQPNADNAGLTLTADIAEALPQIKADPVKLRHMLDCLLDNAVKFTPSAGRIRLEAGITPEGGVAVAVEDNGIGMEAADIPRALRPFGRVATPLTANTSGAGLGLPICKRLADAHGATLVIESRPGEGTRVTITFPKERTLPVEHSGVIAAA